MNSINILRFESKSQTLQFKQLDKKFNRKTNTHNISAWVIDILLYYITKIV